MNPSTCDENVQQCCFRLANVFNEPEQFIKYPYNMSYINQSMIKIKTHTGSPSPESSNALYCYHLFLLNILYQPEYDNNQSIQVATILNNALYC